MSSVTTLRSSVYRLHSCSRTPSVVVCRNSSPAIFSRSSGLHSTLSTTPGRFFFMPAATVQTSSAPASSSRSCAKPSASGVMSSRLQVSSATSPPPSCVCPSIARTQFAISKSFLPMP